MTSAEVVAKVTSWANHARPEVGLWYSGVGEWHEPSARLQALDIIGPDFARMALRLDEVTLVDLMRVLDVLATCNLWSPDAYETGCWVLAKLKRHVFFSSDTKTLSFMQQTGVWRPDLLEQHQTLRVAALDAGQRAVLDVEMGVLHAMVRATVEGYATTGGMVYPRWRLVHPTGNPMPMAANPPLNGFTKAQKDTLVAPVGWRWMQVRYPRLEARVLAALAGADKTFDELAFEGLDEETIAERTKQLQIFMRQGPTLTEGDLTEWGDFGRSLLPLRHHLREVVARTVGAGYIQSFLGRRLPWHVAAVPMDPHEERRIAAAYCGASAATALKIAMTRLQQAADGQPRRMFLGYGQLLPHFDSISYLLDERVPHENHCLALEPLMQLQIATANGLWVIPPELRVGATWGTLTSVFDPQALTKIALTRPGPTETLQCAHCGLTTTSQRVLDTHMEEEHAG